VSHLNMKRNMKIAVIILMGMGCVYVCPFFIPFLLSIMRLIVSVAQV
jgi:hypothetical protein